jgi:hydrogenase-1 operon protein HyaF
MNSFDHKSIQVNLTGPGSQPVEEDGSRLEYIRLPQEMERYCMPDIPEPAQVAHLGAARVVMDWLQAALERYRVGDAPQLADITSLDAANRDLVNQILGEGEVSLQYNGGVQARMQESVLAGIWRTCYLDERGALTHDLIEVADVPLLARNPLAGDCDTGRVAELSRVAPPAGVMNAMPILSEVQEHLQTWQPGQTAHVVNLTLLPLSQADIEFLEQTLGEGPVQTLSRGYGDCQVRSTACPGLWWVRYHNSMGSLILNTLEVVDIPLVACAAQDDLDDSRRRIRELLEPYWQELA